VFGGIISHSPRRGKDNNGWVGRKKIEETKGAQVYISFFIDGTRKTNRPRRNGVLQVVLLVGSA
jgi:hypothetical protein